MNRLLRYIKILKYKRSFNYKKINVYMRRIRTMQGLSDEEADKLKDLLQIEKDFYSSLSN